MNFSLILPKASSFVDSTTLGKRTKERGWKSEKERERKSKKVVERERGKTKKMEEVR